MNGDEPTDDPLLGARDALGRAPYEWAAAPVADGPVLEVTGAGRAVLRATPAEPARAVGHAMHLPLRDNAVAGIALTMCLPQLDRLDAVFAELRRVLRPSGTLSALVPSRPAGSLAELRAWWPLGRRPRFRNESACDRAGWLLAAADFGLLTDDRRTFWVPLPDGRGAARFVDGLPVAGVWPPDCEEATLRRAKERLVRYARPGRRVPIPLRRIVARR